jgi:hypothetical protein
MDLNGSSIGKCSFPAGPIAWGELPHDAFYEPEPAIRQSGRINQGRKQFIKIEDSGCTGGNSDGRQANLLQ